MDELGTLFSLSNLPVTSPTFLLRFPIG